MIMRASLKLFALAMLIKPVHFSQLKYIMALLVFGLACSYSVKAQYDEVIQIRFHLMEKCDMELFSKCHSILLKNL